MSIKNLLVKLATFIRSRRFADKERDKDAPVWITCRHATDCIACSWPIQRGSKGLWFLTSGIVLCVKCGNQFSEDNKTIFRDVTLRKVS